MRFKSKGSLEQNKHCDVIYSHNKSFYTRGNALNILKKPWFIGSTVIIIALIFIVFQLTQFAKNTTLSNWHKGAMGYLTAAKLQQQTNKPMAIFFYTDWCQNCEKLRIDILSSPPFKDFTNDIIALKINPEIGPAEKALADSFGVFAYPSFFIVNSNDSKPIRINKTSGITTQMFIQQCQKVISS